MTKKKRGRPKKLEENISNVKGVHNKCEKDNILCKIQVHYINFLIKFVKAQEENPDNPGEVVNDVVNAGSQTGDFGIWLIIALLAIAVVSAVAVFLYRKYSDISAGNSGSIVILMLVCLLV